VLLDVYEIPGLAAWLITKLENVPIVVRLVGDRLHDLTDDHLKRAKELGNGAEWATYSVMREMNRPIITRADGAIVVSTDLKEKLCARTSFDERTVGVVPVPFRPEEFRIEDSDSYRFRPDEEIIITVTNLKYPGKFAGVKQSLSAIKPVLQRRENAYYIIAGGGSYVEELRTYVDETVSDEIRDRIVVDGFVEDICSLYAIADVMIYISHLDGYPNAVLEAQGLGIPVIANADFGMVDQIEHEETGILVDSEDLDSITEYIILMVEDDTKQTHLSSNARQAVSSVNSIPEIGDCYIEKLERILNCLDS
jgi:glycosyltransferase involved in cell wall biosynthesis